MAGSDLTVSIYAVTTNSNDKIHVHSVNTVSELHVDISWTLGEGSLSSNTQFCNCPKVGCIPNEITQIMT